MAIQNWNGKLRANEIFAFIYNMIISQQVFADDIAGTKSTLVDMSRVDGTLMAIQNFITLQICFLSMIGAWMLMA